VPGEILEELSGRADAELHRAKERRTSASRRAPDTSHRSA
jgi:hypothetical protein